MKEHKVITNDDLEPPVGPDLAERKAIEGEEVGDSICDADCEDAIRQELSIPPEREGEFRSQLAAAKRQIRSDHAWHELLWRARSAVQTYCTLEAAKAEALNNGFRSPYTRQQTERNFEIPEKNAINNLQRAANQLSAAIQNADAKEPVHHTLMEYQAGEILHSGCLVDDP